MSRNRLPISDQYCVCSVGRNGIAVPALAVREVTARPQIVEVPASPPILVGLCHLRNEFLPILSMGVVLGSSAVDDLRRESLVVMDSVEGAWAFTIDRAHAVERLETAHVRDSQGDQLYSSIITGTATFRDVVVRVLDPDALFRSAASILRDEWRA